MSEKEDSGAGEKPKRYLDSSRELIPSDQNEKPFEGSVVLDFAKLMRDVFRYTIVDILHTVKDRWRKGK